MRGGRGEKERNTDIKRRREKETKGKRNRERDNTLEGISWSGKIKEAEGGRNCPLCLGTGHLHRETSRKLFAHRRRFSLGLDGFLRKEDM